MESRGTISHRVGKDALAAILYPCCATIGKRIVQRLNHEGRVHRDLKGEIF